MKSELNRTLLQVSSLLVSVALLILGNGLQTTLLGVRASIEGISAEMVGLMMSAFFGGYAIGCQYVPVLIAQVGHVRTFAALTSLVSAIALMHALFPTAGIWILLRVLYGCFFAGLLLITESWLNGCTDRKYRGRVLAIYSMVFFAAWSFSQLLLTIAPPSGFVLFCLVSILLSLALVPVTLSKATISAPVATAKLGLKRIYNISPIGLVGVITSGLCMSAFFGMGPTFGYSIGLDNKSISLFMFCTFLGGLVLQWPIGWLSDLIDRGMVIFFSSVVSCVISFLFVFGLEAAPKFLWLLSFLFGGFGIPIYSICVAHVNDQLTSDALVSAASGLLFLYGISSAVSPFAAGLLMRKLGPQGLFWYAGCINIPFIVFCALRLLARPSIDDKSLKSYVVLPKTTNALLHLDKRQKKGVHHQNG